VAQVVSLPKKVPVLSLLVEVPLVLWWSVGWVAQVLVLQVVEVLDVVSSSWPGFVLELVAEPWQQ
jgi:hypothetical protein